MSGGLAHACCERVNAGRQLRTQKQSSFLTHLREVLDAMVDEARLLRPNLSEFSRNDGSVILTRPERRTTTNGRFKRSQNM